MSPTDRHVPESVLRDLIAEWTEIAGWRSTAFGEAAAALAAALDALPVEDDERPATPHQVVTDAGVVVPLTCGEIQHVVDTLPLAAGPVPSDDTATVERMARAVAAHEYHDGWWDDPERQGSAHAQEQDEFRQDAAVALAAARSGEPAAPQGDQIDGIPEWLHVDIGAGLWSVIGDDGSDLAADLHADLMTAVVPHVRRALARSGEPERAPSAVEVLSHIDAGGRIEEWLTVDVEEWDTDDTCSQTWIRIASDIASGPYRFVMSATAPYTPQPGIRLVPLAVRGSSPEAPGPTGTTEEDQP